MLRPIATRKTNPIQFSLRTLIIGVCCISTLFLLARLAWDVARLTSQNAFLQMENYDLRLKKGELDVSSDPKSIHLLEAREHPPMQPRWQAYFPKAMDVRLTVQGAQITKTGSTPSLEGGVTRHVNAGETLTIEAHAMKHRDNTALVCLSLNGAENVFDIDTTPPTGATNWMSGKNYRSDSLSHSEIFSVDSKSIELFRLRPVEDAPEVPRRADECTCPRVQEVDGPAPGLLIRLEPNSSTKPGPFVAPPTK